MLIGLPGNAMIDRLRNGQHWQKALDNGDATEEGFARMIEAWEAYMDAEDGVHGSMAGEILITK